MYKYFFLITFFPCLFQAAQKKNLLNDRFKSQDSSTIFLAVIFSNTIKASFPENTLKKYYNRESHSFSLDNARLYIELSRGYNAAKNKQIILAKIDTWLKNDSALEAIQIKEKIQIEEVLYKNYNTKSLFKKFLQHKGETWDSLTSWQSYELYIDFINYAENLSPTKSKKLFESLMKGASKLER
jgi:hypothetical protein